MINITTTLLLLLLLLSSLINFSIFSKRKYITYNSFLNQNDTSKCYIYLNKNWENFEARYGHLNDDLIRKQLFPLIKEVSDSLSKNQCIYDAGGNVGQITQLFHEYYPDNEIHTFEPVNSNFIELQRKFSNIEKIKLNHIALGSSDGNKNSHTINNGALGDYLYPRRLLSEFIIRYMTVDSYYKKYSIKLKFYFLAYNKDIFFFKLDTEGFEDEILFNSKYVFNKRIIKIIYLEYHQGYCKEYESTLIHLLNEYGFNTYLVGKNILYSTNNCPNKSLDRFSLGHVIGFNTDKEYEKKFVESYNKKYSK